MKKRYSKPDLVFENFSLSTSIAAPCALRVPDGVERVGQGGIAAGMFAVFQNSTQGCNLIVKSGVWDGYCYHNPVEFNNIFVS
jgi:hypothetical protein